MNIKEKIEDLIKNTLKSLNIEVKNVSLEHPVDLEMGDFSTNIAMVLAKENKTNPKELAEKIVKKLNKNLPAEVLRIQIAGTGFINFYLAKEFFVNSTREILASPVGSGPMENKNFGRNNIFEGKKVMVEYTQPNPFKPFHIGHLMSNTIGESISLIIEFSGAKMI